VTQQRFQEGNDLGTFDGSSVDLKIEVPESDSGNHRKAFPTESLLDDWGLAAWRPRAHPVRARTQAAFVEEDDGASFACGFFLRRGQRSRFQCAIFGSSRSKARREGR